MIFAASDLLATFLIYLVGYPAGGIIIGYLIYRLVKNHHTSKAKLIKIIFSIVGVVVILGIVLLYAL